ncbi:FAD-binding protein [Glaciihabitans arcticus]|uniref:FAD-binding protein n=1 Tax=Glaciihabitans arcticus TaxID=2668039 RepID=A0A4Q9GZD2_9MICO|nr:FAD-dependent oxidoreductase [Glaciihabitans arcticus]TBN58193.1 FAD-binding protein [Glaciihabitans arcticus]
MTSFVVVGGGVAGLVTARRLALGGATVALLEASDRLGGTVTHHVVGGLVLDAGAESFAVRGDTVAELATELGLGDEIVIPNPAGAWLQRVRGAVALPATSLLGIPGVPLAADVIDVVGFGAALRAYLETLLPGTVAAGSATLGELVRRRMGQRMLDELVAPVTHGVHSQHPDDLPLDRVAPGLRSALRRSGSLAAAVRELRASAPAGAAVAGIRGGVHRLVDELTADLERLGVDVRLGVRGEATGHGDARVVLAFPPAHGSSTPVELATLVVDAPGLDVAPRGSGVLVANGVPGIRSRALTHATAKWRWLADRAEGKHVLRLSYAEAPENLADIAREDAAALLGIELPPSAVLDFARVHWDRPRAAPAQVEGVTQVGEVASGTGLANVVAHAERTARELLEPPVPGEVPVEELPEV